MKHIKKTYTFFLWMLLGIIITLTVGTAVSELYRLLGKFLPNAFPSYDILSDDEFFDTLYTSLWFISLMISMFITVYISLKHNNDRFEFIIDTTEGIYKIPDILKTYVDIFAKSDIVSCVIVGAIYTIPMIFIPEQFMNKSSALAALALPYKNMSECFGVILGPTVFIISLCAFHIAAVPLALKYYRAKWLSGFAEADI